MTIIYPSLTYPIPNVDNFFNSPLLFSIFFIKHTLPRAKYNKFFPYIKHCPSIFSKIVVVFFAKNFYTEFRREKTEKHREIFSKICGHLKNLRYLRANNQKSKIKNWR